ncbi:MAG: type II toxin-antitoxin system Phd/YefM family antitoxin [Janthinobacterium lividum]
MAVWALQDAKAKFSEVVDRALTEGPQEVTRHGRTAVMVVEKVKYDEMVKHLPTKPKMSLGQFLLTIPRGGPDDLFEPVPVHIRDIDFGETDG